MGHISMKNLPESEQPYERLRSFGAEALTDAELLSIILKTGTRKLSSLDVARSLLGDCQGNLLNLYEMSYEQLLTKEGIGPVKAVQLKAVAELSIRIAKTRRGYRLTLGNAASIADYFMEGLRHSPKEMFLGAYFDAKCRFLCESLITTGGINFAYIPPSELFRKALLCHAVMIVVLHNHPSGDPDPSNEDIQMTKQLEHGAKLLGLTLADHIIIGDNCYYSFNEHHML